ncbi:MAG: macro domain-containing protein [Gemmatimonadota bacterium]
MRVRIADLSVVVAEAILRPVAADWGAATPASRRVEMLAGPALDEQCRRLGECPVGSAVLTTAGKLRATYLINVVVRSLDEPVSKSGVERGLRNGLRRVTEYALRSVAVAPLGTGAGNLDAEEAARVMVPLLLEYLGTVDEPAEIEVVVDNEYERDAFEAVARSFELPFLATQREVEE